MMKYCRIMSGVLALLCVFAATSQAGNTANVAVKSCLTELKLPAAACACIGRRAEKEFNAKQQKFFLAAIKNDAQAIAVLVGDLNRNEMTEITEFMSLAPQQCAGQ